MDLTIYRLLVSQLPEPPDLSAACHGRMPIPEAWPLVLSGIHTYRKQIQHFTVSDGTTDMVCVSDLADLCDKAASLEIGTIIHLLGTESRYDDGHKTYVLGVQDICTLKEYDNRLRDQRDAERRRLERLREQGFFEELETRYHYSE